jgi:hypothetical protein
MSTFILTLNLADHTNEHSPTAVHHIVNQLLDQAKQAIGSSLAKEGQITHGEAFQQKVVGTWKFIKAREIE